MKWQKSGYWADIQDSVDYVLARGGGDVFVPAGTFNFVDVGEWSGVQWKPMVYFTAGIRLFGAPYSVDVNGMVTNFGTILRCPWECGNKDGDPENAIGGPWFGIQGTGNKNTGYGGFQNDPVPNDPSLRTRVSGIWLQGYRYLVDRVNGTQMTKPGIEINELQNFRFDHCDFSDITMQGIVVGFFGSTATSQMTSNGVIDHCRLVNDGNCYVGPGGVMTGESVEYGINVFRTHSEVWNHDPSQIFGKANQNTVFVENCEFSKWRHCVSSIDGAHVVFRYNKVYKDLGFGSVDQHGTYTGVGNRAIEMYGNSFTECGTNYNREANRIRGGAGMFYDNYLDGSYASFVGASADGLTPNYAVVGYMPDCPLYLWNNILNGANQYQNNGSPNSLVVGQNVFLSKPAWYVAYQYPHPLVVGDEITPKTVTLGAGSYRVGVQPTVNVEGRTYKLIRWEQS